MTSRLTTFATRGFIALSLAVFSLFGLGCGGNDSKSLGAMFAPSATPAAVHGIKIIQKSISGARLVVQVVVYGPDTTLDMYAFAFDVKIGDPTVVNFVPGTAVAGNALVPTVGQGVTAIASPDASDASHIVVGVTKTGGPPGNGVAGASAVIVELTFDVLKEGVTTLALSGSAGSPSQPPSVLDSAAPPQAIAGFSFDAAAATVTGVSSGGGGY